MCVCFFFKDICSIHVHVGDKECQGKTGKDPLPLSLLSPSLLSISLSLSLYLHDLRTCTCTCTCLRVPCLSQQQTPSEVEECVWLEGRSDWLDLILSALTYLSAEVGAVSSFDPLPFFIPLVEFRDRIDHWKWMGELLSPSLPPSLPPSLLFLPPSHLSSLVLVFSLQVMIGTVIWSCWCCVITGWTPWTDLW